MNICLFCGNNCENRFCNKSHYNKYYYYKKKGFSDAEIQSIGNSNVNEKRFCLLCGEDISDKPITSKYCSKKHRNQDYYLKRKNANQEEINSLIFKDSIRGCLLCGKDVDQNSGRGRKRLYCSEQHKKFYKNREKKGIKRLDILTEYDDLKSVENCIICSKKLEKEFSKTCSKNHYNLYRYFKLKGLSDSEISEKYLNRNV